MEVYATSAYTTGYNLFNNADDVDVSLILGSSVDTALAAKTIGNIAEHRKDCVAVISKKNV